MANQIPILLPGCVRDGFTSCSIGKLALVEPIECLEERVHPIVVPSHGQIPKGVRPTGEPILAIIDKQLRPRRDGAGRPHLPIVIRAELAGPDVPGAVQPPAVEPGHPLVEVHEALVAVGKGPESVAHDPDGIGDVDHAHGPCRPEVVLVEEVVVVVLVVGPVVPVGIDDGDGHVRTADKGALGQVDGREHAHAGVGDGGLGQVQGAFGRPAVDAGGHLRGRLGICGGFPILVLHRISTVLGRRLRLLTWWFVWL
mmetsp:Transcript_916/g.2562  ORF Transcript_916/g.2562 Transcript_916/m.2562 type:complete len:255 (+) Transcript_916:746-1510(+)